MPRGMCVSNFPKKKKSGGGFRDLFEANEKREQKGSAGTETARCPVLVHLRCQGQQSELRRARFSLLAGRMVIHPHTKSVMVALAHLLVPTRRPSLALSLSLPDASKHKHVALASPGRASPAIPRHERKRAQKSRSFRRRQAPITRGQKRTLRELWPKYGLLTDFNARYASARSVDSNRCLAVQYIQKDTQQAIVYNTALFCGMGSSRKISAKKIASFSVLVVVEFRSRFAACPGHGRPEGFKVLPESSSSTFTLVNVNVGYPCVGEKEQQHVVKSCSIQD